MAAIPTILKGDDSGAINITMAEGRSYTGATLVIAYQGVTRSFTNLTPGQTIAFSFTHGETAGFDVKTAPLLMRLIGPHGGEETIENAEARIRVTDCLTEVNAGGSFIVEPGGGVVDPTKVPITDVGDMADHYTMAELTAKVNQIVHVLAQRSLLALGIICGACGAFGGVSVQTARLDSLYNDAQVVTNVTEVGGIDTNAVHSIVTNDVAAWALAGNPPPKADRITDATNTIYANGRVIKESPTLANDRWCDLSTGDIYVFVQENGWETADGMKTLGYADGEWWWNDGSHTWMISGSGSEKELVGGRLVRGKFESVKVLATTDQIPSITVTDVQTNGASAVVGGVASIVIPTPEPVVSVPWADEAGAALRATDANFATNATKSTQSLKLWDSSVSIVHRLGRWCFSNPNIEMQGLEPWPYAYLNEVAPIATNVAENVATNVFAANADYALNALTDGALSLTSGEIGSYSTTTNIALSLSFADNGRSGDCLLYVANTDTNDHEISLSPDSYTLVSADLAKAKTLGKATTNIVSFTRVAANTILVSKQEVK